MIEFLAVLALIGLAYWSIKSFRLNKHLDGLGYLALAAFVFFVSPLSNGLLFHPSPTSIATPVVSHIEHPASVPPSPQKVLTVDVDSLIQAYSIDEGDADRLYRGKRLRIAGTAGSLDSMHSPLSDVALAFPRLYIFGDVAGEDGLAVRCDFSPAWDMGLSKLNTVVRADRKRYRGDHVEVIGTFSGWYNSNKGSLYLNDCDLVVPNVAKSSDPDANISPQEATAAADRAVVDRRRIVEMQFSGWNGSHPGLVRAIKASMHNPRSYDHVKTTYVDNGDYLLVTTTFRGKNTFGAVVLNSVTAKVDVSGNVLEIVER